MSTPDDVTVPVSRPWTMTHIVLATAFLAIGVFLGCLGFYDIFLSVTHLLTAWWGSAAWTVIALGEGSFTGSYLGWMLLDLRAKPSPRNRAYLFCYLSLFVVSSFMLMLYAGRDGAPDLVSHALVVVAFYGFLILLKLLVKILFADPAERALEEALGNARRYAIDLCRALRGPLWRWRVPALLKRQILTGQFPDEVYIAVETVAAAGRRTGWQQAVRGWVTGPDGLNLNAQARVASDAAAAAITREDASQANHEDASPHATRPPGTGMPDATTPGKDASNPPASGGISGMSDATSSGTGHPADGGETGEDLKSLSRDEQARRGRELYEASGRTLSQRDLGAMFGKSKEWGKYRIQEVESGLHVVEQVG